MNKSVKTLGSTATGKDAPGPLTGRLKFWLSSLKSVKFAKSAEADVLIVDTHDGVLSECLMEGVSYVEVPVRGESWFINFRIVLNLLRFSKHFLARKIGLRGLYVLAVASSLHSRIVLTFIDNNNWDTGLVELRRFRLMCIQNGYRRLPELEGKSFDVYCTINELPVHLFDDYKIKSNKVALTGSLRLSTFVYKSDFKQSPGLRNLGGVHPMKVLMPSQFRIRVPDAGWSTEKVEAQQEGEAKICRWLAQLEREGNLQVTVALTTHASTDIEKAEMTFFENHFGYRPRMTHRSEDRWATYRALMETDITVGAASTVLLESLELGIPTLFCFSVYNDKFYDFNKLGVIEDTINLLPRNSVYADFRSAVIGLSQDQSRDSYPRIGRNAIENIRTEVSELLNSPLV